MVGRETQVSVGGHSDQNSTQESLALKIIIIIGIDYFSSAGGLDRIAFGLFFRGNEDSFDAVFLLNFFDFRQSGVLGQSDRVFNDMGLSAFDSGHLVSLFFDTHES